jgi:hypothetical protein
MFLLGVAPHHKRDGFGEFEHGAAVERGKLLPSSSKATVRILPFGARLSSMLRNTSRRREFLNTVR